MRPQIDALTATRAFAAIMVFVFHFGRDIPPFSYAPQIFYNGNIAVSYFFVLSGFVLYISYVASNFRYIDFLKKRIGRIVPVYLLALGLFVIVHIYIYKAGFFPDVTKQILYAAFFIQAYFPLYALTLNTAAWSISVEMLFYLSFPFLLLLQKRNAKLFITLTILMYIVTQVCFFVYFQHNFTQVTNWNFFMYNPLMHMSQFLIGMVGGYLFNKVSDAQKKYRFLPLLLFCIIVLLFVIKPNGIYYEVGLVAPVFMLFIISVAITNPKFLRFRPLVFLGEISYGIYILQFPVRELLNGSDFLHKMFFENAFFYFSLCMLILAAAISYYLLEKPLRKIIANIGTKKASITSGKS